MTANTKPILSEEEIVEAAEGYCPSLPDMPFAGARPAVQQSFRAGARFALAAAEKRAQEREAKWVTLEEFRDYAGRWWLVSGTSPVGGEMLLVVPIFPPDKEGA